MGTGKRRRGWLGCLIGAPLGCAAFAAGALAVAAGLMPVACGRFVGRELEEDFRARWRGRLAVERAHLPSFFGRQEASFALEDPDGRTVLEARAAAPRLPLVSSEREGWGPLDLHVARATIAVGPDGLTNLERCFEPRPDDRALPSGRLEISFGRPRQVELRFSADELAWSAEGSDAPPLVLRAASGLGRIELWPEGAELSLTGSATLEDGAPLAFELSLRGGLGWLEGGAGPSLRLHLAAESLASERADLLLHTGGAVAAAFGPRLEPFSLRLEREPDGGVSVLLEAGGQARRVLGPRAAPELVPVD